jgi:hypothetical protein
MCMPRVIHPSQRENRHGSMVRRLIVMAQSDRRVDAAKRHVEAVHAFHAGLIAETDRHRDVLMQMTRHITVLRQLEQSSKKKLEAAEAACRHLAMLEELRRPWVDTHRDFRRSLRLTRALYREIVKSMDRGGRH